MDRQNAMQPYQRGPRWVRAAGLPAAPPAFYRESYGVLVGPLLQNRHVSDFPSIGEETVLDGSLLAPADPLYERF